VAAIVRTLRLLLASTLTAAIAACGDDDADPFEPSEQPVLEVDATRQSVCLLVTEDLPDEVEELPTIGCDVPHTHEIYATLEYTERDVYPGADALGEFAQVECLTAFEPFVGISAFDSSLSYTWLVPSLNGWNEEDDRDVLCVLADRDGGELTGSMRASEQ
jgi:hypothetical protein